MKNFIFKSESDFHKIIFNKLETIQSEQRHQRVDLALVTRALNRLINDSKLQTQVEDYYGNSDRNQRSDQDSNENNPDPTEV